MFLYIFCFCHKFFQQQSLFKLLCCYWKKIKEEWKRNEHYDTTKIIIFLLFTSYNSILYSCTTVYVCSCFFCSLSLLHFYLYLDLQSIFGNWKKHKHWKNTLLCYLKRNIILYYILFIKRTISLKNWIILVFLMKFIHWIFNFKWN